MSKTSEEDERMSLLSSSSSKKSYKTSRDLLDSASVSHKPTFGNDDSITYSWNNISVWTSAENGNASQLGHTSTTRSSTSGSSWSFKKYCSPVSKQILSNGKKNHVTSQFRGLQDDGVARPGELLAIMGAFGSGKNTLLNTLTFRKLKNLRVNGFRRVNGIPVDLDMLKAVSAYVQKNDLLISTLTVREHLTFHAILRMYPHISKYKRNQRIDEALEEFGLTKCADTLIGDERLKGISVGEMRRLALASEVLMDPHLIFCDEPTSGLDSVAALTVVSLLRSMAQRGKTVICTIHQPSSELIAMFDRILLMAEGRTAFLGTTKEAIDFFNDHGFECPMNFNPTDYFIETLAILPGNEEACLNTVRQLCDAFAESDQGQQLQTVFNLETTEAAKRLRAKMTLASSRSRRYKASWIAQFSATLWRSWLTIIREPIILRTHFIQTIITSLLLSAFYWNQVTDQDGAMNINGAIFLFLINMTFGNVFGIIGVFCREIPIFFREHNDGLYRTDVYFLSKTVAELPLFTIFPAIFTSICYYCIGLNPELNRFLITCGLVILVANVACSLGYLVSCVTPNLTFAINLVPPIIIPLMIFGGFFLNRASVPVYFFWVPYLSWFMHGNEAFLINQWENIDSIQCNTTCPTNGTFVLETFNFDKADFTFDIEMLVVLAVGYRLVAYFALLVRTDAK